MYRDARSDAPSEARGGREVRFGYDDRPDPEPVEQAAPEPAQKPLLLALVDQIVEFLADLWGHLTSL
jgi:hypothetical protein